MRLGGIYMPERCTTLPISPAKTGCVDCRGSNLKKRGSIASGSMKTTNTMIGSAISQKYHHHRCGVRRITAYTSQTSRDPNTNASNCSFVQSSAHEPQP